MNARCCLVVIASLFAPASATAATRDFVRPAVVPDATIVRAACPVSDDEDTAGCVYAGVVYLKPGSAQRETRAHELGHLYDAAYLDDAERARFAALITAGDWTGGDHATSGGEVFADVYAHCRLDLGGWGYGWRTAGRPRFDGETRRNVCAWIARARFSYR